MNTHRNSSRHKAAFVGSLVLAAGGLVMMASNALAQTTTPTITNITATPYETSAIIQWTTDVLANSQVSYGTTSSYTASTTLDSNLVTSHSVALSSLSPNTLYHFMIISGNASGTLATSSDMTFETLAATSTATSTPGAATSTPSTSSDIQHLQNQIDTINQQIATLQAEHDALIMNPYGSTIVENTYIIDHLQIMIILLESKADMLHEMMNGQMHDAWWPPAPWMNGAVSNNGNPVVTAHAYTVGLDDPVTFTGSGFDPNEDVTIAADGTAIDTVSANADGSFTTTVTGPSDTGETTYTFTGAESGESDIVVMTVIE